ncbi:MAG: hypothetical protein KUG77_20105 [Nannocystaceae bacterium]|nr:hypothetical protein [Nannocystaceae bacterium]
MVARCSSASAVLAAVLLSGCAAQREARVRRAWNPDGSDPAGVADGDGETPSEEDDAGLAPPKQGWARVEELLTRSTDVLTTAPSPEVLAELATKWCEVEPVPRQTRHGEVRVCYLYPPVRVKGVALTLELSTEGIIGFVAPELDLAKSQEIATEARKTLGTLCEGMWTTTDDELDLQTCTVKGGSTLAVGRIRPRPDADRWQVSLAVLGAI